MKCASCGFFAATSSMLAMEPSDTRVGRPSESCDRRSCSSSRLAASWLLMDFFVPSAAVYVNGATAREERRSSRSGNADLQHEAMVQDL